MQALAGLWAAVRHRVRVGVGTGHTAGAGQWLLGEVGKRGQGEAGKRFGRGWEDKRLEKEGQDRTRARTKVCARTVWLVVGWWQRGVSGLGLGVRYGVL